MLAAALRLCTLWPPVPPGAAVFLWLPAWPPLTAGCGAAGGLTPVKSLPRSSVTGPAAPCCGAGSASWFCAAGVGLSAVISVYALSACAVPE